MNLLIVITALLASAPQPQSPFACNINGLTAAERVRHFDQLGPALRALKTGVRELKDGYEFRYPADTKTITMLAEWMEQERRCCPFFDITLRIEPEGGPVWLRLTGRDGTKRFIEADAAAWLKK
jgi:hypothetical protein